MKNLKLKKMKIAKINNLSMILGGIEGTIKPYSYVCLIESNGPYNCPTTTNGGTRTLGDGTGVVDSTEECGG